MAVEAAQPFTHNPYSFCAPVVTQKVHVHRAPCPPHASQVSHTPTHRRSPRKEKEEMHTAPVCLDYLKGICQLKRLNCKYAHPHIPLRPGERICEVYVLTGECKFGERCRDYHPPLDMLATPVCAPPMKTDEEAVPLHISEAFRGIYDLLIDLVLTQYDYVRESCCQAVASAGAANPAVAEHFAGIAYTAALTDSARAIFIAHLCEYVYNIAYSSDVARTAFKAELLKRCNQLFDAGEDLANAALSASEEERNTLTEKRFGNAWFFGCLVRHSLVPIPAWVTVAESLAVRSKRWDAEASFSVRLLCRLLQTAGSFLKEARPEELHRALRNIRSAAPRHGKGAQAEVTATYRELTEMY